MLVPVFFIALLLLRRQIRANAFKHFRRHADQFTRRRVKGSVICFAITTALPLPATLEHRRPPEQLPPSAVSLVALVDYDRDMTIHGISVPVVVDAAQVSVNPGALRYQSAATAAASCPPHISSRCG